MKPEVFSLDSCKHFETADKFLSSSLARPNIYLMSEGINNKLSRKIYLSNFSLDGSVEVFYFLLKNMIF